MPTYEYRCEKCSHEFEAFQSMTEPPVQTCPMCAGPVKRIISGGAGFLFKGSGFYITDYRSKEYKAAAEKDKDKTSSASSDSKTSDSAKPDASTKSDSSSKSESKDK
ncbi:MAG TPA: FmdB family zinc ribbon protein [Candidatus Deferrimicrobium sp.]|nr:FmdB family zinc ribbon protein [Candidatus Deferrimicrobium sp.]